MFGYCVEVVDGNGHKREYSIFFTENLLEEIRLLKKCEDVFRIMVTSAYTGEICVEYENGNIQYIDNDFAKECAQ